MEWLDEVGAGCAVIVLFLVTALAALSFYVGFELNEFLHSADGWWPAVLVMSQTLPWPFWIFVGGWVIVLLIIMVLVLTIIF